MEDEEKLELLSQAYRQSKFQEELSKVCFDVETQIFTLFKDLPKAHEHMNNVFAVESRVKTPDSLLEKVRRKDYLNVWAISEDMSENQKLIKQHLTDLIGVRVDCYFMDLEKVLYDSFIKKYGTKHQNFTFDYSESLTQKNGHKIYKFSGVYKDAYHFEIQIKSAIHNVWGEVEHKTIYKNPNYDCFIQTRQFLIESLRGLFEITDKQLYAMFDMNETIEHLLRSLFYLYTKESVIKLCGTSILSEHFQRFFEIFKVDDDVKGFVLAKLQNDTYKQKAISCTEYKQEELLWRLKQKLSSKEDIKDGVKSNITQYKLDCIFNIASQLYKYEKKDDFYRHLLNELIPPDVTDFDFDFESVSWNNEDMDDDSIQNQNEKKYLDDLILINNKFK